jgi:hypothetical protein
MVASQVEFHPMRSCDRIWKTESKMKANEFAEMSEEEIKAAEDAKWLAWESSRCRSVGSAAKKCWRTIF